MSLIRCADGITRDIIRLNQRTEPSYGFIDQYTTPPVWKIVVVTVSQRDPARLKRYMIGPVPDSTSMAGTDVVACIDALLNATGVPAGFYIASVIANRATKGSEGLPYAMAFDSEGEEVEPQLDETAWLAEAFKV